MAMRFVCMYVCAPYTCSTSGKQKKASDFPELHLQTVVSHNVGTVNWTEVGSLEEQSVLLTAEPSPQSQKQF